MVERQRDSFDDRYEENEQQLTQLSGDIGALDGRIVDLNEMVGVRGRGEGWGRVRENEGREKNIYCITFMHLFPMFQLLYCLAHLHSCIYLLMWHFCYTEHVLLYIYII